MTVDQDRFLAFLNTHRFAGLEDVLGNPEAAAGWLDPQEPPGLTRAELDRLVSVRENLRSILLHHAGHPTGNDLPRIAERLNADLAPGLLAGRFRDAGDAAVEVPSGRAAGGGKVALFLEAILAFAVEASTTGEWDRLKACGNPDCTAAFCDSSRNRSSAWCSSRCSNRMNVRAYRHRRQHALDNSDS